MSDFTIAHDEPMPETGLGRMPFFSEADYLALNPDVKGFIDGGIAHYLSHGAAEGRQITTANEAARTLSRYDTCDDVRSRFPYLDGAPLDPAEPPIALRVALLQASTGHRHVGDIADHIACGLTDIGVDIVRGDETFRETDSADRVIVLAPHAFLQADLDALSQSPGSPENIAILNTARFQTDAFARCLPQLVRAKKLVELNYQQACMFQDGGKAVHYYIPGYTTKLPNQPQYPDLPLDPLTASLPSDVWDYPLNGTSLRGRPIDIAFMGGASPIRTEFLARSAAFLASRRCQIVYSQRAAARGDMADAAPIPLIKSAIARRSKILLNIHKDAFRDFEWHRMMLEGFWYRTVVVSNGCLAHPVFKPGKHFFEESLGRIPKLIAWLLDSVDGRAEADRVRLAAFAALSEQCSLRASSLALTQFLLR